EAVVVVGAVAGPRRFDRRPQDENPPKAVALSADGALLAAADRPPRGHRPQVRVWDVAAGKVMHTFNPELLVAPSLTFSPDGRWLALSDKVPKLGALGPGRPRLLSDRRRDDAWPLAFAAGGRLLLWTGLDRLHVTETLTGRDVNRFPRGDVAALSPDGQTLALPTAERAVRLVDVITGEELAV